MVVYESRDYVVKEGRRGLTARHKPTGMVREIQSGLFREAVDEWLAEEMFAGD